MAEEQLEQEEVLTENVDAGYIENDNNLEFFEKNKKLITGIIIAAIVVIGGSIFYQKRIVAPEDNRSQETLWQAEFSLLNEENWSAAIKGDSLKGNDGLKKIAEEFSGYSGGRIAQYELGIAYLNNAQYDEAINALKEVDFDDEMISTVALGAIGDAYIELNNVTDAANYYQQAYKNSKNELTTPLYMLKAANAKELESKFDEAVKIYDELIAQFPNAEETEKAIKNIELARAGKSIHNL